MFADDNFKFDECGRVLSRRVENTVGKGESLVMAISPSSKDFSKVLYRRHVKTFGLVRERVQCINLTKQNFSPSLK